MSSGSPGMPAGPPETHEVVAPGLPADIASAFDAAPAAASGLALVYPNAGAVVPRDLAPVDVQWQVAPGRDVYRVELAAETGDRLRGYVTTGSWLPPESEWRWLLTRAAGRTVTLTVTGGALAGGQVTQTIGSDGQPLRISRDDATGALFYFATTGDQVTGDGTLERLSVGATKPDPYLNKSNNGGRCVGCHTLTRDGKRLAFVFFGLGLGSSMSLGAVEATDPTKQLAPASQPAAQATFSPDGTRMVTSTEGKLTLRDASGMSLGDIATSGPALYPDWSPDGKKLVFVRPAALCKPAQGIGFGQQSIFVYGGSLVTMEWNGSTFANEQVLLQATAQESNYYPSFSPDGAYLAFTRADGKTRSSWSSANDACAGKDGSGVSYDNPSATIWILPLTGGAPIPLSAANGEPMRTNSWPRWAPKADGEYLWLSFSSTRPYGNVLAGDDAHHQIWLTAVAPKGAAPGGDPSSPAVWFPFQNLKTKNHIGTWSLKVGDYVVP